MKTRLRAFREARLLTQQELADRSGVAVTSIFRIEHGQVAPRFGTLRKLATALAIEPFQLIADPAVANGVGTEGGGS